jgi:hypothetical protein
MTTVAAEAFHQCIHDRHIYGLGEVASQTTARPLRQMRAWMGKWWRLEAIVMRSGAQGVCSDAG